MEVAGRAGGSDEQPLWTGATVGSTPDDGDPGAPPPQDDQPSAPSDPVLASTRGELLSYWADQTPDSAAAVDAHAQAQRDAVLRDMETRAADVAQQADADTAAAQAAPPTFGAPTKESLERQLDEGLARELAELDGEKTTALEDLDEEIARQTERLDGAVVPDSATDKLEREARAAAKTEKAKLTKAWKADSDALQATQKAEAARAEDEAKKAIETGDTQAKKIEADGKDKAFDVLAEYQKRGAKALSDAATLAADKPEEQAKLIWDKAFANQRKLLAQGAKAHDDALRAGRLAADNHRDAAKQIADTHRSVAAGNRSRLDVEVMAQTMTSATTLGADHQALDGEAQTHVDKAKGMSDDTRATQRAAAAETLAALHKSRTDLEAKLDREIEDKRKKVTARIEAMRKRVKGASPARLARLATSVASTLSKIDASSEDLHDSAERQVEATTRRIDRQATQTVARMTAQGAKLLAEIEVAAAAAKQAIEARARRALEAQASAGKTASERVEAQRQIAAALDQGSLAERATELKQSAGRSLGGLAKFHEQQVGAADASLAAGQEAVDAVAAIDWAQLEADAESAADEIEEELDAWVNTDEDGVQARLREFADDPIRAEMLIRKYEERTGKTLDLELGDDMDDLEMKEAGAYLRADLEAANVAIVEQGDDERVAAVLEELSDDPEGMARFVEDIEVHTGEKASDLLEDMVDEDAYAEVTTIEAAKENAEAERLADARAELAQDPAKLAQAQEKAHGVAEKLNAALAWKVGVGNDFEVTQLLGGLSPAEVALVKEEYALGYGDLDARIAERLDGKDLKAAKACLSGDPVRAAVALVEQASDGVGTNTETWRKAMETLATPEERAAFAAELERQTGTKYEALNKDENSGLDRDMMAAQAIVDEDERAAMVVTIDREKAAYGGRWSRAMDGLDDVAGDLVGRSEADRLAARQERRETDPMIRLSNLGTDDTTLMTAGEGLSDRARELAEQHLRERTGMSSEEFNDAELSGKAEEAANAMAAGEYDRAAALRMIDASQGLVNDDEDGMSREYERKPGETDEAWFARKQRLDAALSDELADEQLGTYEEWTRSECDDLEVARALERQASGEVSDATELALAGEGAFGTRLGKDGDKLAEILSGRTPEGIDALAGEMGMTREQFDEWVLGKAGSINERRTLEVLMEGNYGRMEPEALDQLAKDDPQALIERVKKLHEAARGGACEGDVGNAVGNAFADTLSDQGDVIDARLERALALEARLDRGEELSDADRDQLIADMKFMAGDRAGYVETKSKVVDTTAEVAGTAVEVGVTALAGPQAGAAMGGLTEISIKAQLNAANYSADDVIKDVVQTAVSTAMAGVKESEMITRVGPVNGMAIGGMSAAANQALDVRAMRDGGEYLEKLGGATYQGVASGAISDVMGGAKVDRMKELRSGVQAALVGAGGGLSDTVIEAVMFGDYDKDLGEELPGLALEAAGKAALGAADTYHGHHERGVEPADPAPDLDVDAPPTPVETHAAPMTSPSATAEVAPSTGPDGPETHVGTDGNVEAPREHEAATPAEAERVSSTVVADAPAAAPAKYPNVPPALLEILERAAAAGNRTILGILGDLADPD